MIERRTGDPMGDAMDEAMHEAMRAAMDGGFDPDADDDERDEAEPDADEHHAAAQPDGGGPDEEPGDEEDEEDEEELTEHAVTAVATGMGSLRPPRRTGIFVDPEELRDHVGHLLRTILGGYEVDAFGNFTFTHEDARVFVTVGGSPIGPTVGVFSVTNLEVDLTPGLAAFLLATNHSLGFGAFSYDPPNRAIWLRHTLLGTTLDGPELQSAVAAVATTAARLDDHIRDRFGGRTFQEAPGEVQRRVEPPSTSQDAQGPPGATGYL
jgi:hypothetical protein